MHLHMRLEVGQPREGLSAELALQAVLQLAMLLEPGAVGKQLVAVRAAKVLYGRIMLVTLPIMLLFFSHYAQIMLEYLNFCMPKVYYTQYTRRNSMLVSRLLERNLKDSSIYYSPEAMVLSLTHWLKELLNREKSAAVWTLGTSWDETSLAKSHITGLGTRLTSRICPKMYMYLICSMLARPYYYVPNYASIIHAQAYLRVGVILAHVLLVLVEQDERVVALHALVGLPVHVRPQVVHQRGVGPERLLAALGAAVEGPVLGVDAAHVVLERVKAGEGAIADLAGDSRAIGVVDLHVSLEPIGTVEALVAERASERFVLVPFLSGLRPALFFPTGSILVCFFLRGGLR